MMSKRTTLRIIAASSVAIFSLASLIGGAYAWFTLAMTQSLDVDTFSVVNLGTCELYSVDVIKFEYQTQVYGTGSNAFTVIDYFSPEHGAVNEYAYNKDENSFGYYEDEAWNQVALMNTYDPVDLLIHGSKLSELHCNAIYKFVIRSTDFTDVNLNASIVKLTDRLKNENELFLSDYVDYDIYFASDLLDTNPLFIQEADAEKGLAYDDKLYYPSYISKDTALNAQQDVYYKLSYLSSLKTTHSNFYESGEDEESLALNHPVEFVPDAELEANALTFYVNVNYAPSTLEFAISSIYQGDTVAVYDYAFKFYFFEGEGE